MIIGLQKKKLGKGVGGWGELYPNVICMFGIVLTLQGPKGYSVFTTALNLAERTIITQRSKQLDHPEHVEKKKRYKGP